MLDIIVADDDATGRALISKLLLKKNCRPILARNGVEAWKQLKKSKARIMLTDWMMPEMNGLDLCRKIRADDEGDYVYIIVVTANEQKKDAIEGLKAGADDYITKPIFPEELWARIRSGQRVIELEDRNKKVALQLFQADKMASVGQLAAGVAHEINNPTGFVNSNLKTLSGYANDVGELLVNYRKIMSEIENGSDALKQGYPTLLEYYESTRELEEKVDIEYIMDDVVDIINDCMEGTNRIKKIVADMKDFAHPGQDDMKLVDLNNGIDSTLNVINNEIKYKATVVKEYGDLPPVLCYPQQMNQVFMNILVNAAHAIEQMGEIRIITSFNEEWVIVKIQDNGKGIKEENLSKIFDPFFTTKEVGEGTGLGMNVAYNIIQKHAGTINVDSEVGKGNSIYDKNSQQAGGLMINNNILIVDDEESFLKSISRVFRQLPYTLYTVTSAKEALQIAEENEIAVILSDLKMPGMDGIEFLETVNQMDPKNGGKPEQILMTGHTTIDRALEAINRLNLQCYITKPWIDEELVYAVHKAFDDYNIKLENIKLQELTEKQNLELIEANTELEDRVKVRTMMLREVIHEGVIMLATAAEDKDECTGDHIHRILELTHEICVQLGLTDAEAFTVSSFSMVHDVGKIYISEYILNKRGVLDDVEWEIMKTHTLAGEKILGKNPFYKVARKIARSHHENWDGSGYPDGLQGSEIPFPARIVAVADVFDALVSKRPYKDPWSVEKAIKVMKDMSGKKFDPDILDAFFIVLNKRLKGN